MIQCSAASAHFASLGITICLFYEMHSELFLYLEFPSLPQVRLTGVMWKNCVTYHENRQIWPIDMLSKIG